jgi:leader peptidase (prepilin peptidase)/N-methyltransferase
LEVNPVMIGVMVFLFGSMVGSFLNVVIARLPQGRSIVAPRSQCPSCGQLIHWYDNIPLLSFVILSRRCRNCRALISWRYPLVELITGLVALALWWRFGLTWDLGVHFLFCAALVAIVFIDIDHLIIPNEISLPGIVIGFACSFRQDGFWQESLIGLGVGGGTLLLVAISFKLIRRMEGMGMGDVKLLAMLGAWLGWRSILFVLLFASVQTLLVSAALWLSGVKLRGFVPEEEDKEGGEEAEDAEEPEDKDETAAIEGGYSQEELAPNFLKAAVPFGPFLALAAVEYLFLGNWFYGWMLGIRG